MRRPQGGIGREEIRETANQACDTLSPRNQVEQLQMENEKLKSEVKGLELEVLNLYRRIDERGF